MEHPENSKEYKGLTVNAGIEQPSTINPYLKRSRYKRQELSVADMVEGIVKGNVTILSQAVTLIESVNPSHQQKAQEVIEKCLPYSGNSVRIGISGVPGAGKSTSIDEFGVHVLDRFGGKLAVLAIDPSSERSKGSILGDKTRMEKLALRKESFIRPSPSAGSLGGVARKTRETIILCEAAGYDKIFVETVGVGQSETACHSMVDFFLLIQLAGTGDELQGIKRGIMEIADGIIINKCDGNNVEKCQMAATSFRNALHFFLPPTVAGSPRCSATADSTAQVSKRCGIWCMNISTLSSITAILTTAATSRANTGCMRPSTSSCAATSTTTPTYNHTCCLLSRRCWAA